MGWFSYKCLEHGLFKVSLTMRAKEVKCTRCDSLCQAVIKGGSMQVVERLDNGVMSRRVERLHNIEELMDERNEKTTIKQDEEDE